MSGSFVDHTLRIRGGALIASIAFHLAVFYAFSQMKVSDLRPFVTDNIAPTLRIQVELISPITITDTPPSSVIDTASEVESIEVPADIIESPPEPDAKAVPVIPQATDSPLLSDDVPAIDAVPVILETSDSALSRDDRKTIEAGADSWIAPDAGPQDGAFGSVFNPRLRQRLQEKHSYRSTARSDGPLETRNAYGDRRVILDNERCMRARQSMRPGETTDWYLTSCGGFNEGEKMLRRVEQSLRKHGK
jgi:hypothetical protein